MKMTIGAGYSAITCTISAAKDFRYRGEMPCGFALDTLRYAVCRYIRKDEELRSDCVRKSYRFRLARRQKPVRCTRLVPARDLHLPGHWAQFAFIINAEGVTVTGLSLLDELPAGAGSEQ